MNQEFLMKVQLGDKIKMLPKAHYETITDLAQAARRSYPKRLQDKQISLKYVDEEGDWLYLSEDDDLAALNEFATKLDKKKVKLVVEVEKQAEETKEVKEVNQAMADVSLEEKKEEVKFEDLKDFKLSDAVEQIEGLLNSEEKFGKMKIWKTIKEAAKGTKAEHHFDRFGKSCKGWGGKHKREKMFRKFFSNSTSNERDNHSSSEEFGHPGFGGPMGPYGAPQHYGPHPGFEGQFMPGHGHGHGPFHNKRGKKFFKKFMKSFRSSSSDGSSSDERKERKERKERRKAKKEMKRCAKNQGAKPKKLEFKLQDETIVGKAGEKVNFTVGIKDIAPHPIWITGAKKVEGEAVGFEYHPIEEAKVFREKEHEVELTATLPTEAGEYPITIGFVNKKDNFIPGHLALNFRAE